MSHQFETGFSVRQVPWHGLGEILDGYPTRDEARTLAGLDWEPSLESCYDLVGIDEGGQPIYEAIEDFKQVKRSDTGARLSIVPKTYTPIANDVLFDVAEAILEAGEQLGKPVKYETAGVLDAGRRVWCLVNLGETQLPGDPSMHAAYLYVASSHDRSAALRAGATDVRVVCANTEAMADDDAKKRGTLYSFAHTRNVMARVEDAKKVLTGAFADMETVYERARALLEVKVTAAQREAFVRGFAIERAIRTTDVKRTNMEELLEHPRIISTVNASIDQLNAIMASETCAGIVDTAYGLTSAAIELLDHGRPAKSAETRFTRTVLERETHKTLAYKVTQEVLASV